MYISPSATHQTAIQFEGTQEMKDDIRDASCRPVIILSPFHFCLPYIKPAQTLHSIHTESHSSSVPCMKSRCIPRPNGIIHINTAC